MAKKRRKFSYRTVRVIVTLVVFAIAVGYPAYQNYFASNRAINQWTDKQKIKPSSIGNITDNQLPKLAYEGQAIVQVNGGAPTFSDDDLKQNQGTWEKYGNLDKLGRATQANALVGQETMPTTDRSRL
jgi:DNA-entry nuclease